MSWSTSDRRARLPDDWNELRFKVIRRDRGICQIRWDEGCEGAATDVDHKVHGDNHDLSNLQAACDYCHIRKSSAEGNLAKAKLKKLKKRPESKHPGLR